jgi:hypothetical protein
MLKTQRIIGLKMSVCEGAEVMLEHVRHLGNVKGRTSTRDRTAYARC